MMILVKNISKCSLHLYNKEMAIVYDQEMRSTARPRLQRETI
jgi:hypothetical protein